MTWPGDVFDKCLSDAVDMARIDAGAKPDKLKSLHKQDELRKQAKRMERAGLAPLWLPRKTP